MGAVEPGMPDCAYTDTTWHRSRVSTSSPEGCDVWQTELPNLDFARVRPLCGGFDVRVGARSDLGNAIRSALDHEAPAMVHIDTDPLLV